MDNQEDIYNKVFGDMIKPKKDEEEIPPLESLLEYDESIQAYEKKVDEWMNMEFDYIPPYLDDPAYIEHMEREPVPPISREEEFSASTLGLQELRKTKKYIGEMHKAINVQLKKVYVTYPLLLEKHYEEALMQVQEKMFKIIEDMEHLIAGDIDKMARIKEDWKLFQEFQEKRLILLHKISDYYKD